ncbi:MAG: hypothetical protein QNJ94_16730 [Alphaproteobacteria bacterium]|nr:hypothetical protein [Alphaproteobacteria bacterium]
MELGVTSVIPDPGAPRPQSPVINQRPEVTVQPAEPEARNEPTGRNGQQSVDRGPSPPPAELPLAPQTGATGPGPAQAGPGGSGAAQRLSEATAQALSRAAATGQTPEPGAEALRNRAAEAYLDSVQRASTARPTFDFVSSQQAAGGSAPASRGDEAPAGRIGETSG